PEAAFFPLHAGDGRALLWNSEGPVSENRRYILFGFRSGENGQRLLRGRVDATLERSTDYPHGSDPAALAGKHWTAGWRHHGIATLPFRDQRISRLSTTFCPAISLCRSWA